MDKRKKVVVIGANFGGLTAAMRLKNDYSVTVIDPGPYFEFLPNIHELVSGVKSAEQLRLSRRRLLRRAGHRFVQDEVTALDTKQGHVVTRTGEAVSFDACVVAVGGINNTLGVPGAEEYALPFKSVSDCEAIGDALSHRIERQSKVSVVIVGGGLEGVESLGEILRAFRNRRKLTIHLVDSSNRLLPTAPAGIGKQVEKHCRKFSVQFYLGQKVQAVTESTVKLASGDVLPADMTIWTGGATAPGLLAEAGLAEGGGRWAPVEQTLQSKSFENIFVIGDAAELPTPISKQSYYATDMGECAAENIVRYFSGSPLRTFKPSFEVCLISFGDLDTFLVLGNRAVAGTVLASAKEFIYQFNMARYDPPWSVMPFFELQTRFWDSFFELVLPTFMSPLSLLRFGRVRFLA